MISSTLNHRQKEKKRKREFGRKEKMMKRIRCCVIGVFGSPWMHSCVKHKKQESVWIRREWWWKSGRQWEKSGKKRGGKKGKGKKWFWEKSFCFCLTVSLPLPFFSLHPPPHHATTHAHTHPLTHHTTWRFGAHHHMQTGPCAVLSFFGVDSKTHCIIHTPHSITTHTNQPNTDTTHGASNNKMTIVSEKGIGQREKKRDNTAAPTHWLKWQQTQWLWNTLDCG